MSGEFLSQSAVRDEDGKLKMMFRGDYRADALRKGFKVVEVADGGSGGLYFTDNSEIASSYATTKQYQDDEACDTWRWINVTVKHRGRDKVIPLESANLWLSSQKKKQIADMIMKLSDTPSGYKPTGEDPVIGESTFNDFLARNRHDYIKTMIDLLHDSGLMFGDDEFLTFIKECDVFDNVVFNDPYRQESIVTPVYLDIRNPLSTDAYPEDIFDRIEAIVGKDDEALQYLRETLTETGMETVTYLTPAFRNALLELGYDGIKDVGGRVTGADSHTVYIALSPEQIRPAYCKDAVAYRKAVELEFAPAVGL